MAADFHENQDVTIAGDNVNLSFPLAVVPAKNVEAPANKVPGSDFFGSRA
jgi:hypothetical protein